MIQSIWTICETLLRLPIKLQKVEDETAGTDLEMPLRSCKKNLAKEVGFNSLK